jgi:hypothetical protein
MNAWIRDHIVGLGTAAYTLAPTGSQETNSTAVGNTKASCHLNTMMVVPEQTGYADQ